MLISQSLESSIETSDSMVARSYTNSKRKSYSVIRFNTIDTIYFILFLVIGIMSIYFISKYNHYTYYPQMDKIIFDLNNILMYSLVTIMNLLLIIIEGCDRLKWHYLKSKI